MTHSVVIQEDAQPVIWEYLCVSFGNKAEDGLNKLGVDGWELILQNEYREYVLKRRWTQDNA